MSMFPDTPTMLLTRIAMQTSGEDSAVWTEFFELYTPVMRTFLVFRGVDGSVADDIVQDVLLKLVALLTGAIEVYAASRYEAERKEVKMLLAGL